MRSLILLLVFSAHTFASNIKPLPPPPTTSQVRAIQGQGEHYVALKGLNDKWVAAHEGGGSFLIADRGHVSTWETFRVYCRVEDCSEVSLKTMYDQWVSVQRNRTVLANAKTISPSERFRLETRPGGLVTFQTMRGAYLSVNAEQGHLIDTAPYSNAALFKIKVLKKGFYHRPQDEL